MPDDSRTLAPSPAFTDASLADALARAATEQRWLLVDVVDSSNPVSWAAAYTTWRDSDLLAWVETHAIALRVDACVDAATAQTLRVAASSAPMILVFRDRKERFRIPGRPSTSDLLEALGRIDVAEDNVALHRKMLKHPERDMPDRNSLADALLRAGLLDEALEHYDWLWQHATEVDPEMDGVRISFMANKIEELCEQMPAAHARFGAHRDRAAVSASTVDRAGMSACVDFVVLNKALHDTDRTVTWLDGLDAVQRRALSDGFVDLFLVPLLIERQRWADAGTLIRDPLAELDRRRMYSAVAGRLYARVAELQRSLVAAGRVQDAAAVRDAALQIEDTPAMRNAVG